MRSSCAVIRLVLSGPVKVLLPPGRRDRPCEGQTPAAQRRRPRSRSRAPTNALFAEYGSKSDVIVLSTVLRIKRTLDGAEIDEIIRDVVARKALAVEHRRRPIGARPSWLRAALGQNVTPMPQPRHALRQIWCSNRRHQRSEGRRM